MITKKILLTKVGDGVGIEFGFDLAGWWINHEEGGGTVRTYLLFGPTRHIHNGGEVWAFHCLCFRVAVAILKEDSK